MKDKSIGIEIIIEFLKNEILSIKGDFSGKIIKYLRPASKVDIFTLDWVNPDSLLKQSTAEKSQARVILVDKEVEFSTIIENQQKVLIYVINPKISVAKIGHEFFTEKKTSGIHPTASIDPMAQVGENVFIGAGCVIGDCTIGEHSCIYPNTTIYNNVSIGKHTIVHSGAVIGVDGLGCIRNSDGSLLEFPQLGGVTIGNNVYIGANTHIACGSLSQTIIGDGAKINGLCFVGSNCQIGNHAWITGSAMLAGSVTVGENTTIYSKVVIREHTKIGRNVILGMGAVVTRDVPDNEVWIGTPAKKMKPNV